MLHPIDARMLAVSAPVRSRCLISSSLTPARSSCARLTTPYHSPAIRPSACSTVPSNRATSPVGGSLPSFAPAAPLLDCAVVYAAVREARHHRPLAPPARHLRRGKDVHPARIGAARVGDGLLLDHRVVSVYRSAPVCIAPQTVRPRQFAGRCAFMRSTVSMHFRCTHDPRTSNVPFHQPLSLNLRGLGDDAG